MHKVIISAETHALAKSISLLGMADAPKVDFGRYEVELSDEAMERLDGYRFVGETNDQVIFRVLSMAISKVKGIVGAVN